jgi:hypothetical protein
MSNEADLPAWVSKRDGRLVPFDADRISRSLFAAGEAIGAPDAFLARELADGVVHFVAMDSEGETPTTARIAEVVEQVVRELGHPALALAFARQSAHRVRVPQAARMAVARRQAWAYTRDLESARDAGLLLLPTHDPDSLCRAVLGPPTRDLASDVRSLRRLVGHAVALDGLESRAGASCPELARQLAQALEETGLGATANLNLAPPSWADPVAAGPLFADAEPGSDPSRLRALADEWLDVLLARPIPRLSIDWHLGAADFEADASRLERVASLALGGAPVAFVFDRPRRPLSLGPGLDRRNPAVLLEVGLNLPALARQAGLLADVDRFRQRLGTLARLALSAATQKRDHVRQAEHGPELASGFLLDRARLVVVPVGLDEVVTEFTGWGTSNGGESLELGRSLVRRLREALAHDGRLAQMDCRLDGPAGFRLEGEGVAGLTPWDARASLRGQVRAGSALHAGNGGSLALFVRDEDGATLPETLANLWRQTEVVRVELVRPSGGLS